MNLTRSNIYRRKECGQCGAADIGAYGLGCHHDPNGSAMRMYVAVDALLSDEAIAAARSVQCEERGIDLKDSWNAQALGPDEWRWARASIRAAVDAATGKERNAE